MTSIGTAAALLLAVVFVAAALAKLRAPDRAALSFSRLGLGAPRLLARLVPPAELALGALLVWRPRAGAVVALLSLVAFSIVVERARASGVRTGCGCFGGARLDAPLSSALLRNAMLAVAAVVGLAGKPGWLDVPAVVAVSTAAVMGLVVLALWDLRWRTGSLWDHRLAEGETKEMSR